MAERQLSAPTQDLENAILAAARTALKKVNLAVPSDHPIFSDLRDFAKGRNEPNATASHDFMNAAKAKQFVSVLVSELKKAGVYPQYESRMDIRASGTEVVFTQKAAGGKSSSSVGEAMASAPLRGAIDAAAQKVGIRLPEADVATFVLAYEAYLKDKRNHDLNGGSTMLLKIGPQNKAQDFSTALQAALEKSGTSDVTLKVQKDFPPDKYAVVIAIPELTATAFTQEEVSGSRQKRAR